ncbi:hypothetical protein MRBBS_1296 [Marinobacter sp. BSs20148]|nr:hypothetical protein MRBBS_1296 [Marinobacter sp. BSs20148]
MMEKKRREQQMWSKVFSYDLWMDDQGIPVHKGYYIEDLRTIELGWWQKRKCNAAFVQLTGQEGVSSTRVVEIPPGESLSPIRFGFDEICYPLDGRGMTTLWQEGTSKKTFEWQPHSMFLLPRHHDYQLSNAHGDKPVRVLLYNYLPMAMSAVPDAEFFFDNPMTIAAPAIQTDFYSEAKIVKPKENADGTVDSKRAYWYGNFFPDMRVWDKLEANIRRGAGGKSVFMQFPHTELSAHMSQFGAGMYKKAHRHGPGRAIVIPKGEGYSILWEEGKEKIVVPWHECSMFVPPDRWFHQHFNTGTEPARYLALHPPVQFHGHADKLKDRAKDQIEYMDEDPWIREKFEEELAKNNTSTVMPPEAYTDRDFDWAKFAKASA